MITSLYDRFGSLIEMNLRKEMLTPEDYKLVNNVFSTIVNRYGRKYRAYHNLTHINWCLDKFTEIAPLVYRPIQLELAIWFHDIVYNRIFFPSLNEKKSACLMKRLIGDDAPYHAEVIINSTKFGSTFKTTESEYMHDIDYSILAADWPVFLEYRQNIRKEFWYFPIPMYKKKEIAFLQYCLKMPIFVTDYFKDYEQVAKININNYLDKLHSKQ